MAVGECVIYGSILCGCSKHRAAPMCVICVEAWMQKLNGPSMRIGARFLGPRVTLPPQLVLTIQTEMQEMEPPND